MTIRTAVLLEQLQDRIRLGQQLVAEVRTETALVHQTLDLDDEEPDPAATTRRCGQSWYDVSTAVTCGSFIFRASA